MKNKMFSNIFTYGQSYSQMYFEFFAPMKNLLWNWVRNTIKINLNYKMLTKNWNTVVANEKECYISKSICWWRHNPLHMSLLLETTSSLGSGSLKGKLNLLAHIGFCRHSYFWFIYAYYQCHTIVNSSSISLTKITVKYNQGYVHVIWIIN